MASWQAMHVLRDGIRGAGMVISRLSGHLQSVHVQIIVVSHTHRHRGIARTLFTAVEAWGKEQQQPSKRTIQAVPLHDSFLKNCGSPTFGVGRSEPTYGGGWSVSHGLVAVWTRSPDTSQPAAVLAAVKDKPYGRPERRAFLDCRSTRRRSDDVGRDGRMGSAGGTNKRMDLK